jgi:hypothetical protein
MHNRPTARQGVLQVAPRQWRFSSGGADELVEAGSGESVGLVRSEAEAIRLAVHSDEAYAHAAVLRGVAHAQYRRRDANSVEVTLSAPAKPSRLMEVLPKQHFSWARLYDTRDSLIELASRARRRLTIASPFLDRYRNDWGSPLVIRR